MWLWLLSPLGRKVAAAIIAVGLLLGCVWYVYGKGKEAGRVEGAADQLQQDRKQFEQDRQQFLATLKQYKEEDDAAKQVIAQKDGELAQLKSRRDAQRRAIAALPEDKVLPDVRQHIGSSENGAITAEELRTIDQRLSDADGLQEQIGLLVAKSDAQDARISALEKQRDAAVTAYNNLVPLYAKAYNAAQKKPNWFIRLITLGKYKGRRLDLPAPVSLQSLP